MDKSVYDDAKMIQCSESIGAQLTKYRQAKQKIDDYVTNLVNGWDDSTHSAFTQKYNAEAKVAAENLDKIMQSFADTLLEAANAIAKVRRDAENGLK